MPLEIVDDFSESAFARSQTGLLFDLPQPAAGGEQLPAGISLCMIVKNEERFLADCLRSVRDVVDEINIVDTGSADRTVEIAQSFGATVISREWRNDFGWARNESLALATRRWTLVLDADEEVAPESLSLLRALRDTPADATGVYVRIQNLVDDPTGTMSTMTHILPRLFPTSPRIRYVNVIHESLMVDGERHLQAMLSPILVKHKGYTADVMGAREKTARNQPLLERALREAADDAFSWFNFGVSAIAGGDTEGGIAALERMFAMPGERRAFFPIGYVMLATAYIEAGRPLDEALRIVDDGLRFTPDHPNLVFARGFLLARMERYEEAREWYERAANSATANHHQSMVDDEIWTWKAPLNLATTYVNEGRDDEAVPWFERAYANKRDSGALRALLAAAYERVGRFFDAERLFRDGAERGGDEGFVAYVNYLMRRRRFHEAFERVECRLDAVDDDAYVGLLLSAAQLTRDERLGDPEPYALRALALAPGNAQALALLEDRYRANGDDAKLAALLAAELEIEPRDAAGYARRSHRLLDAGDPEGALTAARRGLARAPNDPVLSYNAALAAARLGRDAEALALLDTIPLHDARATAALALAAEIRRRCGDLDGAVAALRRIGGVPKRDEGTFRHAVLGLSTALLAAGRIDEAGSIAGLAFS